VTPRDDTNQGYGHNVDSSGQTDDAAINQPCHDKVESSEPTDEPSHGREDAPRDSAGRMLPESRPDHGKVRAEQTYGTARHIIARRIARSLPVTKHDNCDTSAREREPRGTMAP
jgi:hypothetical protein